MNSTAQIILDSSSSFFESSTTSKLFEYSKNPSSIIYGLVSSFVLWYTLSSLNRSRKGKLPPGPRGLPFFGNLFQLSMDAWVIFTEWKYKYGDLVYISAAGQDFLILNSHKVAADLLDRRAAIYSDRPRLIVASEILTGGVLIPFTGYNDVWRRMRRASHEGLNNNTARNYFPAQLREASLLVTGVLQNPKNWADEINRAAVSMILGVVYDKPSLESNQDPAIAQVNDFIGRIVRAAYPGAHFAEFFRWMKFLPASIAKWKREALEWYAHDSIIWDGMYDEVKKNIANGDERDSFAATLIKDERNLALSEAESSWLAATIYTTGAETTSTVMAWFMLAMVHFPEVQRKAQAEIDAVVGRDRLPTFADRDHLPYIVACVREALRWKTAAPLGVPHQSIEDDWYEGHFIPKGTICIANQWSMNKDPAVYGPDADQFKPERHLDANGQLATAPPDTKDEGHVGYGFGRRICVGRHVANNSVYIDIAALLWGTTIAPLNDAQGKPIMPDTEGFVNDGLVLRPIPFECSITPRFAEVDSIVAQTNEMYET